MKLLAIVATALLLCSCASGPVVQSSFTGDGPSVAPTSPSDPRMLHRQFYSDDDGSMPWLVDAPHDNR